MRNRIVSNNLIDIQDGMRIIKNQESNDFFSGKIYDMVRKINL